MMKKLPLCLPLKLIAFQKFIFRLFKLTNSLNLNNAAEASESENSLMQVVVPMEMCQVLAN